MLKRVNPNNKEIIKQWEKTKRTICEHVRLELGVETIYQLCGQLILLGLALSETKTTEGLTTVFKDDQIEDGEGSFLTDIYKRIMLSLNITNSTWNAFLLCVSIFLSFLSIITRHIKALYHCRERFPLMSMISATFYGIFSSTTRILSIVIFFSVPLGLFSLLKHLQVEQVAWNPEIVYNFVGMNATGNLTFGADESISWKVIDRFTVNESVVPFVFDNDDKDRNMPKWNEAYLLSSPTYVLYTHFTLLEYFLLFLGHLALKLICLFIAKYFLSIHFRENFSWLEKFIHIFESCNITYNAQEWDDGQGDANDHVDRMKANFKETFATVFIKLIFNLMLLSPLWFLGKIF